MQRGEGAGGDVQRVRKNSGNKMRYTGNRVAYR